MKTLLLMRHAKSSWKHSGLPDKKRPLKKRGMQDAPKMGKHAREKGIEPEVILCSTATRAKQTAELFIDACKCDAEVIYMDSLYHAEISDFLEALSDVPDHVNTVMIIGHNPSLEALLQILSDEIEALPTGALAQILLPVDKWDEISVNSYGKMSNLWYPREI